MPGTNTASFPTLAATLATEKLRSSLRDASKEARRYRKTVEVLKSHISKQDFNDFHGARERLEKFIREHDSGIAGS